MALFEEALLKIRETWPSNGDYLDDMKGRLTGAQPIVVFGHRGVDGAETPIVHASNAT